MYFTTVTLFAAALTPSASHPADKRPWDVARFSECISMQGQDQLDPMTTVSSIKCSRRDRADKEPVDITDLTVDATVVYSRSKTERSDWVPALAFSIGYKRRATILGGNAAAGFAQYARITLILDGKLVELPLQVARREVRSCGSLGRGAMRVDTCAYDEVVWAPLTLDQVAAFHHADATPGAIMKIKIFGEGASDFTMDFCPAEVVAVAEAAKHAS